MSLVSSYESPYVYATETVALAGFNFTVTDASTGLPLENARCNIHAGLDGTGDADGGYTDANGIFGIDAQWFVPRSWSVSKEGYIRQISNNMISQIPVALEPTTIIYTVNILAGTGGSTVPSGFIDVEPNTELTVTAYPIAGYIFDYWVYKGANAGSINPVAFLIDRDAITITAAFKVSEDTLIETYRGIAIMLEAVTANIYFHYAGVRYLFSSNTPIENVRAKIDELLQEPPPNGDTWPITKPIHIFDNVKLKAEWWDIIKEKSRTIINIDTAVLVGGRLDYTVKYTQGLPIAEDANIAIEGMNIVHEALSKGESKSGSIDLTGLIGSEATFTISFPSAPGIWSEVMFDVWITLGYSEEPKEDPRVDDDDFFEKYGKWIALGIAGVVILYMMRKPSIIVIGGTK